MTYVKSFDLKRCIIFTSGMMSYIEVIRQILTEQNLSQQQFADILGLNQTTVSQWLLGRKKPGYDSIMLLYEKFGIEPNELFGVK